MKLIITCEHAGNKIPGPYQGLFKNAREILNSHRGYDPGALDLFEYIKELSVFSHFYPWSRLLVEVNRSYGHHQLFSEYTEMLAMEEKKTILETFYRPYRDAVETDIEELIRRNYKIFHLSIHSFTPVLNEEVRNADVGLLFDPSRNEEKKFSKGFKDILGEIAPSLKVRYNYPYLGKADGFTTYLRKKFPLNYVGIELEVNQKFSGRNKMETGIKEEIFRALQEIIKQPGTKE